MIYFIFETICNSLHIVGETVDSISLAVLYSCIFVAILSLLLFVAVILAAVRRKDNARIKHYVKAALYLPENGNPLHLKDGERLPRVDCIDEGDGIFTVTITTAAASVEDIEKAVPQISAGLKRKFKRFAATQVNPDIAFNSVVLTIEDVKIDRTIIANSVDDLLSDSATKLRVQQGTEIDLTTSGSMLFAGKTRSGKTTGCIASVLLPILARGRDSYNSSVVIIDPKQAELSCLPYTVTLDPDGEARGILKAMKEFADTITKRQHVLNDLSERTGDAVHWYDNSANMKVCLLFLDEFVSARSLFPKKAAKGDDYCLDTFDNVLKRIVTMGASAGCYVIISIAEASVESGGLPAMLRSAMSTRILFRPTMPEARLMWDSEKLKTMPERTYGQGDAWFSSTDGVHDNVSYVHFPILKFPTYKELGRLLTAYYGG